MGDNSPNNDAEPNVICNVNVTPVKLRQRRKSAKNPEVPLDTPNSNEEIGIKSRLRGADRTPGKLCKDSTSDGNVKILKKAYQAESVSLRDYLGKQSSCDSEKQDN